MIPQIINHYKPTLCEIPWVERYGGLVKIVRKELKDGKAQTFPVTCDISEEECFNSGRHLDLVPDSRFKSILYWQETGPTRILRDSKSPLANYNAIKFSPNLKLVLWVNLAQFGKSSCDDAHLFAGEIISRMTEFQKNLSTPYKIQRFKMIPSSVSTDPAVVFKGLTYANDSTLQLYPYASISIDFQLEWEVLPSCLPAVDIGEPIPCVDFSL